MYSDTTAASAKHQSSFFPPPHPSATFVKTFPPPSSPLISIVSFHPSFFFFLSIDPPLLLFIRSVFAAIWPRLCLLIEVFGGCCYWQASLTARPTNASLIPLLLLGNVSPLQKTHIWKYYRCVLKLKKGHKDIRIPAFPFAGKAIYQSEKKATQSVFGFVCVFSRRSWVTGRIASEGVW